MLDDLKFIHNRDKSDALGVATKQLQQLEYKFDTDFSPDSTPQNVVIAGMGGSALAATFITAWPGLAVPFEVNRTYSVPDYVNEKTLFVASSYSGNTEETLSALAQAEQKNAQIVVISAGGKLAQLAKEKSYPLFTLPTGLQPRMAVFYNYAALIQLLVQAGLVEDAAKTELRKTATVIKESALQWKPDVPTNQNQAKQIALELVGKSSVIYASSQMFSAAYKWKININENAKNIAWCNQLPELNHNEFLGWSSHPINKPYAPIFLQSSLDHPRVTKRFALTKKLLSGKMPEPIIVEAQGDTILEQLLWTVVLGDFVSLYLAMLNNIDPTPVALIEKLKSELA